MSINVETLESIRDIVLERIMKTYGDCINTEEQAENALDRFTPKDGTVNFITTEDIINSFKDAYRTTLNETSIETLKEDALMDIENQLSTLNALIRRTKNRWAKEAVSNDGMLEKEMTIVSEIFNFLNKDTAKFKELTHSSTPQEYRLHLIELITSWLNDNSLDLGAYRYLLGKKTWQIIKAIKQDSSNHLLSEFKNLIIENKSVIWQSPFSLSHFPVSTTNRKVPVDKELVAIATNKNLNYIDVTYYEIDNVVFKSRLDIELFKDGKIEEYMNSLTGIDNKVAMHLLSLADETFVRTREIVTTIGEIIKALGLPPTGHNYMLIKESIFKLQYLTSLAITPELRGISLKILDNVEILNIGGRDTVRVLFNEDVVNQLVNKQTINMYKDDLNNFTNEMSFSIVRNLHIERIKAFSRGENTFRANYNTFARYLLLSPSNKSRNIKNIVEALDEIVNSGKTISYYERSGSNFYFEFTPITEKERRDLLINLSLKSIQNNTIELYDEEYYQISLEDTIE